MKLNEKFPHILAGREIDAIIDYLICRQGHKFIGCGGSAFSILLQMLAQLEFV